MRSRISVHVLRYTPSPVSMNGWLKRRKHVGLSFRICFCVFMILMSRHDAVPTISHFASAGCDTFSKNIHLRTMPSSSLSSSVATLFTELIELRMERELSVRSFVLSNNSLSVSADGDPHSAQNVASLLHGNLHTLHRFIPLGTSGGHTFTLKSTVVAWCRLARIDSHDCSFHSPSMSSCRSFRSGVVALAYCTGSGRWRKFTMQRIEEMEMNGAICGNCRRFIIENSAICCSWQKTGLFLTILLISPLSSTS